MSVRRGGISVPDYGCIAGAGTGGHTFMSSASRKQGDTTVLTSTHMVSSVVFPREVAHHPGFSIVWNIDFGGGYLVAAGGSTHNLYVTKSRPNFSADSQTNIHEWESLYYIACGAAAAKWSDDAILNALVARFDKGVVGAAGFQPLARKPKDGNGVGDARTFGFWISSTGFQSRLGPALESTSVAQGEAVNLQCGAFASLFKRCAEVLGLNSDAQGAPSDPAEIAAVILLPEYAAVSFQRCMLVNGWQLAGERVGVGANGVMETAMDVDSGDGDGIDRQLIPVGAYLKIDSLTVDLNFGVPDNSLVVDLFESGSEWPFPASGTVAVMPGLYGYVFRWSPSPSDSWPYHIQVNKWNPVSGAIIGGDSGWDGVLDTASGDVLGDDVLYPAPVRGEKLLSGFDVRAADAIPSQNNSGLPQPRWFTWHAIVRMKIGGGGQVLRPVIRG